MKVTSIKQQLKDVARYSVFVDNKYCFSLSESALLNSKLTSGQELDEEGVDKYKQLSSDDKIYNQTLRLVASRPKTMGEVRDYLRRKKASPPLADIILNKLSDIGLINDKHYAENFVSTRLLLRPTSKRKLSAELTKRYISKSIIDEVLKEQIAIDKNALVKVIEQKRRQSKYQDNLKLMQYLARQGFNYDDIKSALSTQEEY
jgi:regulatory protein